MGAQGGGTDVKVGEHDPAVGPVPPAEVPAAALLLQPGHQPEVIRASVLKDSPCLLRGPRGRVTCSGPAFVMRLPFTLAPHRNPRRSGPSRRRTVHV